MAHPRAAARLAELAPIPKIRRAHAVTAGWPGTRDQSRPCSVLRRLVDVGQAPKLAIPTSITCRGSKEGGQRLVARGPSSGPPSRHRENGSVHHHRLFAAGSHSGCRLQRRGASMSIDIHPRRPSADWRVQRLVQRVARPTVRRIARPVSPTVCQPRRP